jgi:extradiol dioxygenase family protein
LCYTPLSEPLRIYWLLYSVKLWLNEIALSFFCFVWAWNLISYPARRIYCDVYATNKTGSSSDDWIYYQVVTHSLLITLTHRLYSFISRSDTLQSTVAHALGFSVH